MASIKRNDFRFLKKYTHNKFTKRKKDVSEMPIMTQSFIRDVFKLLAMLLIFSLFLIFHGRFKNELKTSLINEIYELTTNQQNATNVVTTSSLKVSNFSSIKEKLDQLDSGFAEFLSEHDINEAIKLWRAPKDDLMYGNMTRRVERSIFQADQDAQHGTNQTKEERLEKLSKKCEKTKKYSDCVITLFANYLYIRQVLYEVTRKLNRNGRCKEYFKQRKITKRGKHGKNTCHHIAYSKSLFPKQQCYCRNGQVSVEENLLDQIHLCRKKDWRNTEKCDADYCDAGYHFSGRTCKRNKCTCEGGRAARGDMCSVERHQMSRCLDCQDRSYFHDYLRG